jgi:ribosome-associated protein
VTPLPREVPVTGRVTIPASEISLAYARSGGPGGQHVNRTETKVLLRWNVQASAALDDAERALLLSRLASRLTKEGDLLVASERHRDRARNVEDALERFRALLRRALARPRPRKPTKPTRASRERRLEAKRRRGETKRGRREPPGER